MRSPVIQAVLFRNGCHIAQFDVDRPTQSTGFLENDGTHNDSPSVSGPPALRRGARWLRNQRVKKSRIAAAISAACVSSAKWPVSKKRTTASGISRLNASAPDGRKNGSFLPHTARKGGLCLRKYSWNDGYSATLLL